MESPSPGPDPAAEPSPQRNVVVVAATLVVLCGAALAFFALIDGGSPPSDDPGGETVDSAGDEGTTGSGFLILHGGGEGHRVLLEAEAAEAIEPPVTVLDPSHPVAAKASKGRCCFIGPEKVNESPEIAQYKRGHPAAKHPGFARYTVTVPATDRYALWIRAWWADDCGDSVSVSVNGAPPATVSGTTYGRWSWVLFRTGRGDAARIRMEAEREHTLTLCNREDDVYFDQILLLGTDRAWPDPVGAQE